VVAKAIVSSRFSRRRDVPDRWNAGLADVKVLANVRFAPEAAIRPKYPVAETIEPSENDEGESEDLTAWRRASQGS